MELKRKENVASVDLFEVRMSEDELSALQGALDYMMALATEDECVTRSGATREELADIKKDIRSLLRNGKRGPLSKGSTKAKGGPLTRRKGRTGGGTPDSE